MLQQAVYRIDLAEKNILTGFDGAASGYKRQIRYIDVAGQLEMVGQLQRGQYSRLDWRRRRRSSRRRKSRRRRRRRG